MTTEGPAPEGRSNTGLIILGLAAVLLIGTVVGLLLGGGGEPAVTTLATGTSTTTTVATTASSATPTTTTAPSTTTTPPPPEQFAFAALEDTTIDSGAPNEILGTGELLQIEQEEDDIVSALVRFEVTGLPTDAEIASAVLQLNVVDASSVPGVVSQVGGPWSEAETTWASAPPVGVPVTTLPGGTEGAPLSIDLTSLVTGPGVIDLYLTTSSDDGMDFASRESATGAPTLVVTLGPPETPAAQGNVLVGAGDIAGCASDGDEATAALLDEVVAGASQAVVFTTGDNAYESGSEANFLECYDPSWGRHKDITRPALGSREYRTPGATGHFGYFGVPEGERDKGYYSYDFGGWHVVVLNSNCDQVGGCHAGSAQELWLREDLAASDAVCTVAFWHHPAFSSGQSGGHTEVLAFHDALAEANAELVINGDDHVYERFAPQNPGGQAEDDGIRQFIVGTGGRSLGGFNRIAPNSDVRYNGSFGVLVLNLLPDSYEWQFRSVAGANFSDIGNGDCG